MDERKIGIVYVIHDYCYFNKAHAERYEDGKDFVSESVIIYSTCDIDAYDSINSEYVTFFDTMEDAQSELNDWNEVDSNEA